MSFQEGLEPWMPNGFPPPSFVVETERTGILTGARNRWLAVAALLGAILLMAGLLALAGSDDDTALRTSPRGTAPADTAVTFPSGSDLDPLAGDFQAVTSTLPIVPPTLPSPANTAPPGPVFTVPPAAAPTVPAGVIPLPPPGPATPPPNPGPTISSFNGKFIHLDKGVVSPCEGAWSVKATVEDPNGVQSVRVSVSTNGAAPVELDMTLANGVWARGFTQVARGSTTLIVRATDALGAQSAGPEQTFRC
ncbi:MAG: hypothetical protein WKF86_02105 [Acidimicrobiales bacterium]